MNVSSSPSEDALLVARPLITMRTGETFSATPATVPHVNYAWSKLERVKYERHPEGPNKIAVAQPNARKPIDHIEPHLLLKTRALDTPRAVHSHCAHYRYNDACVFGAECRFVHAVHLDPNAKPYQKARIRRLDRKGSSATSTGQSNNGSPLDSDQSPTPMQQLASPHHGSSLTAPPAVHPITSGGSVDSLPSMSVSFLPPSTMMASAALSQPPAPGFWAPPAPTTHLSRWPPPSQFAAPAYHQPLPPHLHDSLASSGLRVVSPSDSMHGIMLSSTDTAWVPMAAVLANHGGAFNPGQPASALPAEHHLVAPSALQAQPPFWAPTAGHVAAPTFPWGDQQQQQLHH